MVLTRTSCFADYTGEEVLPEVEDKKLKDVLLEPTHLRQSGFASHQKWWMELPTSQVVVSSKMCHVCSRMIWRLKLTKAKYQSFQFSKPWKYGQIKYEEMFEIFNMGSWSHACGETRKCRRVKNFSRRISYEIGRIVKKTECECGDKIMAKDCIFASGNGSNFQVIAEQFPVNLSFVRSSWCLS